MSETGQHAFDFVDLSIQGFVGAVRKVPELVREEELVLGFAGRSSCNGEAARQLLVTGTPTPFGDVRGDRRCGLAQVRGQAEALFRWEGLRLAVDIENELVSLLPDLQPPKVFHARVLASRVRGTEEDKGGDAPGMLFHEQEKHGGHHQ